MQTLNTRRAPDSLDERDALEALMAYLSKHCCEGLACSITVPPYREQC